MVVRKQGIRLVLTALQRLGVVGQATNCHLRHCMVSRRLLLSGGCQAVLELVLVERDWGRRPMVGQAEEDIDSLVRFASVALVFARILTGS